jgi:hypothetical protein
MSGIGRGEGLKLIEISGKLRDGSADLHGQSTYGILRCIKLGDYVGVEQRIAVWGGELEATLCTD